MRMSSPVTVVESGTPVTVVESGTPVPQAESGYPVPTLTPPPNDPVAIRSAYLNRVFGKVLLTRDDIAALQLPPTAKDVPDYKYVRELNESIIIEFQVLSNILLDEAVLIDDSSEETFEQAATAYRAAVDRCKVGMVPGPLKPAEWDTILSAVRSIHGKADIKLPASIGVVNKLQEDDWYYCTSESVNDAILECKLLANKPTSHLPDADAAVRAENVEHCESVANFWSNGALLLAPSTPPSSDLVGTAANNAALVARERFLEFVEVVSEATAALFDLVACQGIDVHTPKTDAFQLYQAFNSSCVELEQAFVNIGLIK